MVAAVLVLNNRGAGVTWSSQVQGLKRRAGESSTVGRMQRRTKHDKCPPPPPPPPPPGQLLLPPWLSTAVADAPSSHCCPC